jgi:hypothetical protein
VIRNVVVGVERCNSLVRDVVVSCELETCKCDVVKLCVLNGKHLQYVYCSTSSHEVNNSLAVLKFCEQTVIGAVTPDLLSFV